MNEIVIEINNLTKKYKNTLAVKGIDFKINKGSIIGLLGPNGCGKSTTIGMMLGLIKPTTGEVLINKLYFLTILGTHSVLFSCATPTLIRRSRSTTRSVQKLFEIGGSLSENLQNIFSRKILFLSKS